MKNHLQALAVASLSSIALLFGACSDSDSGSDPGPTTPPVASLQLFAGNVDASGYVDGAGANARFGAIRGLVADSAGVLYASDGAPEVRAVRRISTAGDVSTLAGGGTAPPLTDGAGGAAGFYAPGEIAIDAAGTLTLADVFVSGGGAGVLNRVSYMRKITPAGAVTTPFQTILFPDMRGLAIDAAGNMVMSHGQCAPVAPTPDSCFGRISRYSPQGVATVIAATPGAGGTQSSLLQPSGMALDSAGNMYVGELVNDAVYRVTPAGIVSAAIVPFTDVGGLAVDGAGNIYVAATGSHTVKKIAPNGLVTTVAGVEGQAGFTPGALPGLLRSPNHLAIVGNDLYISMDRAVVVVRNRP